MKGLNFKPVSTEIIKMDVGHTFIGKYLDQSKRPWVDPEDGEIKEITQYHFLKVDDEGNEIPDSKTVLFADAGLQNIFNTENITKGTIVKIDKLEKITRGKKQINQYKLATAN